MRDNMKKSVKISNGHDIMWVVLFDKKIMGTVWNKIFSSSSSSSSS